MLPQGSIGAEGGSRAGEGGGVGGMGDEGGAGGSVGGGGSEDVMRKAMGVPCLQMDVGITPVELAPAPCPWPQSRVASEGFAHPALSDGS